MVKVAFIVEGDVEKIVVDKCFIEKNWLEKYNITPIKPVINAGGGGNLCPKNDDGENIVNVGDTIMYDRYKASDLKQDFIIYHSVYFSDLIMIFED